MTRERLPIVYIDDVEGKWWRQPGQTRWQASCDTGIEEEFERREFEAVDDAIKWGRQRAEIVLVRLGHSEDEAYSAGTSTLRTHCRSEAEPT